MKPDQKYPVRVFMLIRLIEDQQTGAKITGARCPLCKAIVEWTGAGKCEHFICRDRNDLVFAR